jgi:hypothetical protein
MGKIIIHKELIVLITLMSLFQLLFTIKIVAQVLPAEDLFSFSSIFNDRYIRISERIKEELGANKNYIRNTYYKVKIDPRWTSDKYPTTVFSIYYDKRGGNKTLELLDDGDHFDNAKNDGIYSNYLVTDLNEYETDEFEVDICCLNNSISIHYSLYAMPLILVPSSPQIYFPANNQIIPTLKPIICYSIDPNADGCHAILLAKNISFGDKLEEIIWEKQHAALNSKMVLDTINTPLFPQKKYSLIIWSYINAKKVDDKWQNSSYSIEKSSFTIDTTIIPAATLTVYQNYPNPFYETTIISWMQQNKSQVTVTVYDILGRSVKNLVDKQMYSGINFATWDGKDVNGHRVAQGIYFLSVAIQDERRVIKIAYLKR